MGCANNEERTTKVRNKSKATLFTAGEGGIYSSNLLQSGLNAADSNDCEGQEQSPVDA